MQTLEVPTVFLGENEENENVVKKEEKKRKKDDTSVSRV